jgi:hypothetical protein
MPTVITVPGKRTVMLDSPFRFPAGLHRAVSIGFPVGMSSRAEPGWSAAVMIMIHSVVIERIDINPH